MTLLDLLFGTCYMVLNQRLDVQFSKTEIMISIFQVCFENQKKHAKRGLGKFVLVLYTILVHTLILLLMNSYNCFVDFL